MNSLKKVNVDCSKDIIYHLEKIEGGLFSIQIQNNRNIILSRSIDIMITNIRLIKKLVQIDPRFDWKIIQKEMDKLFKEDTSLTGFSILFDFEKCEKPKRALIPLTLINTVDNEE